MDLAYKAISEREMHLNKTTDILYGWFYLIQ